MQKWLRLRKQRDFQHLRRVGMVKRSSILMLSTTTNHLTHNRYAVVASKRVGNAVQRNRLRRQVREILRQMHPFLKQGYDINVIVYPKIKGQPFDKIQRIVYGLCKEADLVAKER